MTAAASNERRDLEYGVLGPLRVTRSGTLLPLGGPQQRAVLALLLLEADKVVSVSQLADALWGDCPPVRLITTVQTYVFHLREILEPGRRRGAPGRVLVTESGGYRLQVGNGSLDAALFERLVRSGQAWWHEEHSPRRRMSSSERWTCGAEMCLLTLRILRSSRPLLAAWRKSGSRRSSQRSTPSWSWADTYR
jgi:hypothetical protein